MSASLTQITRCRPYVRSLIDTGFYSEIPMHRGVVERVELAGGYTVELSLSGDVFDGSAVCEVRLVTAWLLLKSEAVPVAILDGVLLSSGEGSDTPWLMLAIWSARPSRRWFTSWSGPAIRTSALCWKLAASLL